VVTSKKKFVTIDDYLKSFPAKVQKILKQVRQVIREAAPDAEETINYQIPTFRLNGNLVHFAAFKNHIGFYPGSKAIEYFSKEFAKFKSSKGAVQFPIDRPMPLALIIKIVKHRMRENNVMKNKKNRK